MPGGIQIFHSTQGMCVNTGITTGGKKSSQKWLHSESSQANPWFWRSIKWCNRSCLAGHRKHGECRLSICLGHSSVTWLLDAKGGGFGECVGISAGGLPVMFHLVCKREGSMPRTGQTFRVTGLYFFFAVKVTRGISGLERGQGGHDNRNSLATVTCNQIPHVLHLPAYNTIPTTKMFHEQLWMVPHPSPHINIRWHHYIWLRGWLSWCFSLLQVGISAEPGQYYIYYVVSVARLGQMKDLAFFGKQVLVMWQTILWQTTCQLPILLTLWLIIY